MAMDLIAGRGAPMGPPSGPGPGGPGPGGPAPGPGGPDLAALLGAGAGDQGATPGADNPAEGGSELEALDAVLSAIDGYMQIPTVSEQERLLAEKMSTIAQQLKASNEKMADQISGGSPAARKAFGGGGGGGPAPGGPAPGGGGGGGPAGY